MSMKMISFGKDGYLLPNCYKLSLLHYSCNCLGGIAIWVSGDEGIEVERELNEHGKLISGGFGIAGSPICTNNGITYTKKELQSIVDQMSDESLLCFSTQENKNMNIKEINAHIAECNGHYRCGPNQMSPAENRDWKPEWNPEDGEI